MGGSHGWVSNAGPHAFGAATLIHRLGAARVLALAYQQRTGTAVWADPYHEAVTLGWIHPGAGRRTRSASAGSTPRS